MPVQVGARHYSPTREVFRVGGKGVIDGLARSEVKNPCHAGVVHDDDRAPIEDRACQRFHPADATDDRGADLLAGGQVPLQHRAVITPDDGNGTTVQLNACNRVD